MTWCIDTGGFHLPNYRHYQYDLVKKYLGKEVLEVGTGDREFTRLLQEKNLEMQRCVSIEPSKSFFTAFSKKIFPSMFTFLHMDLFNMTKRKYGDFDTVVFIHVLEHIKEDKKGVSLDEEDVKEYIKAKSKFIKCLWKIRSKDENR